MTSMAMARPNRAIPAPIGPGLQGQYSQSLCLLYVNYDTDAIYACIYNSYLIMFLRSCLKTRPFWSLTRLKVSRTEGISPLSKNASYAIWPFSYQPDPAAPSVWSFQYSFFRRLSVRSHPTRPIAPSCGRFHSGLQTLIWPLAYHLTHRPVRSPLLVVLFKPHLVTFAYHPTPSPRPVRPTRHIAPSVCRSRTALHTSCGHSGATRPIAPSVCRSRSGLQTLIWPFAYHSATSPRQFAVLVVDFRASSGPSHPTRPIAPSCWPFS